MLIAQIIPLRRLPPDKQFFDYLVLRELYGSIKVGSIVEIPWQRGKCWGVVYKLVKTTKLEAIKTVSNTLYDLSLPQYFPLILVKKSREWRTSPATSLKLAVPDLPKKFSTLKSHLDKLPHSDFSHVEARSLSIPSSWSSDIKEVLSNFQSSVRPLYLENKNPKFKTALILSVLKEVKKKSLKCVLIVPTKQYLDFYLPFIRSVLGPEDIIVNDSGLDSFLEIIKRDIDRRPLLIMGLRSSVFSPVRDALYILDEEDSQNFEEKRKPNYRVSEILFEIASMSKSRVLLLGSRPTLLSFDRISSRKVAKIKVEEKNHIEKIHISLLDERRKGNPSYVSYELEDLIKEAISSGKSAVLFHNRVGWGKRFICLACRTECYDPKDGRCPDCQSLSLKSKSLGSAKLELALSKNFPRANILKVEGNDPAKPELDSAKIIIATQAIFSFHPLSFAGNMGNIGLVAIIALENNFMSSDFRGKEKEALLISRLENFARGVNAKYLVVQHWRDIKYDDAKELKLRNALDLPV